MAYQDYVEPLLQSIAKAERHIRSEYGTRMVGVMDTIGDHPHFAMMLQPGAVTVLSGRPAIDVMYKESVERAAPQASRILSQRASDWYVFIENVPTRLWIDENAMLTVQTVTMFVTDDVSGIAGEYAWQRHYPPQPASTDGLPRRELDNLQLHEDLLEAVCSGDQAALTATLDPACIWAQRDYRSTKPGGEIVKLAGASQAAAFVTRSRDAMRPVHVTVLNRQVRDWYVFAEELWLMEIEGSLRRQYRASTIYAVNADGRFEAVLGFGKTMEPPSSSAGTKLGLAFFPAGVGPDTTSHKGYPEG